jgi:hypothetical protein
MAGNLVIILKKENLRSLKNLLSLELSQLNVINRKS